MNKKVRRAREKHRKNRERMKRRVRGRRAAGKQH